jgi:hypothetical protein
MLSMSAVRYLFSNQSMPDPPLGSYNYLFAGNGVWKQGHNRFVHATIPLAPCRIAGLPNLKATIHLRIDRLDGALLFAAYQDARANMRHAHAETMYHLFVEHGVAQLLRPAQYSGRAKAEYQGGSDPAIILDIHSHPTDGVPFFSATDDTDEQGFRFYAVMSDLLSPHPIVCFRLGIYGDFCPVPGTLLFTHLGPFTDAFQEVPCK